MKQGQPILKLFICEKEESYDPYKQQNVISKWLSLVVKWFYLKKIWLDPKLSTDKLDLSEKNRYISINSMSHLIWAFCNTQWFSYGKDWVLNIYFILKNNILHNVPKWSDILWKSCKILKFVWPFWNVMHWRVSFDQAFIHFCITNIRSTFSTMRNLFNFYT